jgi:hypothetical protein
MISVPCGCGIALLIVGVIIGGVLFLAFGALKDSAPYQESVEQAVRHPEVIEALGNPVEPGWQLSGNLNVSGPSGEAEFSVPLKGPQGKGTLYVEATRRAGEWTVHLAEVEVQGRDQRIDLLAD